mmetsp:Transcript_10299/g.18078  ORF Transcript_10299/g.18078 Transcript_10299/m.18078 type:complete len:289 (-) Transcript_10299:17-883(-)
MVIRILLPPTTIAALGILLANPLVLTATALGIFLRLEYCSLLLRRSEYCGLLLRLLRLEYSFLLVRLSLLRRSECICAWNIVASSYGTASSYGARNIAASSYGARSIAACSYDARPNPNLHSEYCCVLLRHSLLRRSEYCSPPPAALRILMPLRTALTCAWNIAASLYGADCYGARNIATLGILMPRPTAFRILLPCPTALGILLCPPMALTATALRILSPSPKALGVLEPRPTAPGIRKKGEYWIPWSLSWHNSKNNELTLQIATVISPSVRPQTKNGWDRLLISLF